MEEERNKRNDWNDKKIMGDRKMLVSICIPCYRSQDTIEKVVEEIKSQFAMNKAYEYEIILVNDGSPDDTFGSISRLCKQDEKIIGIDLAKNFGQTSAKMAALNHATGDYVIFMDDDGQHPADGIFKLISEIEKGYDVVYASFKNKKHSFFKRITSKLHNDLAVFLGNKPKGLKRSSFMIWSKFVADAVRQYKSPFPSPSSYLMHVTLKYGNVEIDHRERIAGKSGYSLKKLFNLWINTFVSFSVVPLRVGSVVGFILAGIGFLWGLILIIRKILHPSIVAGYTSMMSVMFLLGGFIIIMLGLIGEYVARIYMTLGNKPQYVIRTTLNKKEE